MHALVRGAVAAGLLSLPSWLAGSPEQAPRGHVSGPAAAGRALADRPGPPPPAVTSATGPASLRLPCPAQHLPELDRAGRIAGCLPVPVRKGAARAARARRLALRTGARLRLRTGAAEDRIPRLPGRSERYEDYVLPVAAVGPPVPAGATSTPTGPGEDDLPGSAWSEPAAVGIRFETNDQEPVTLARVEDQVGDATIRLVGELYGVTVVSEHQVRAPAGERTYLVFYGHLARPGPQVVNGATAKTDAVVGYAGDLNGTDTPHLYLEVRQLRQGASPEAEHLSELVEPSVSVPCDPRNVLEPR